MNREEEEHGKAYSHKADYYSQNYSSLAGHFFGPDNAIKQAEHR